MADPENATDSNRKLAWFAISRSPFFAAAVAPLSLATAGVLLAFLGLIGLNQVFGKSPELGITTLERSATNLLGESLLVGQWTLGDFLAVVIEPATHVLHPFIVVFSTRVPLIQRLHALLSAVWLLMVWEVFGAAIARTVMVRLATGSYLGIYPSVRFALRKLITLIGTPLAPILLSVAIALPGILVGLLRWIPGVGESIAAVLGFIPLISAILMAVLLFGLALGWPLIAATIAAENEDGFDAISRSYSYVNQRPLLYAFLLLIAVVSGTLGLFATRIFAEAVCALTAWSTLGGVIVVAPWKPAISVFLLGWVYAHFWASVALIYLKLRQDVDGSEYDEIARENQVETTPPTFIEPEAGPSATTE